MRPSFFSSRDIFLMTTYIVCVCFFILLTGQICDGYNGDVGDNMFLPWYTDSHPYRGPP